MPVQPAANWYRDPYVRHELRYWDGGQWTQHVVSRGSQGIDPPVVSSLVPDVSVAREKVTQEARRASAVDSAQVLDATLFTAPILVVAQKPKLFELQVEYAIRDQHGKQIGAVRDDRQHPLARAFSILPDMRRRRRSQVLDVNGRVRLTLTRPSTIFRSKMTVRDRSGAEIGRIVQKNLGILKIHFNIESGGELLGSINGEDWESSAFNIRDSAGNEIGRIGKKQPGMVKQLFMKGEDYILAIHQPQDEPLRSLLVASPLAIDAALRRDYPVWEARWSNYRHRPRWNAGE